MNNTTWKVSDVEEKLKAGKIRGYVMHERRKEPLKEPNGKIVSRHYTQRSKEKDFIAWCLWNFAQRHGVILYQEYRFDEERRFRFDWCIPDVRFRLAVEYDGGIFDPNGDHRSVKGMQRDMHKINLAQQLGYVVLRFSVLDYKTLPQALKKYDKR